MREIPIALQGRMIAFLRYLSNKCKECLHTQYCDECDVRNAKLLLNETNKGMIEPTYTVDGLKKRMNSVIVQLKSAGRPLLCTEITLNCSGNLKGWTLNRMVRSGMIVKTKADSSRYRYSIP